MSISAISGSSATYQSGQQDATRQAFLQLVRSLNAGDLSGSQEAYAALTKAQSDSGKTPDPNSPLGQALSQIGQALQSGDIDGAQKALAALKSQARGHHHHHHKPPETQTATSDQTQTGNSPSVSITIDIKA